MGPATTSAAAVIAAAQAASTLEAAGEAPSTGATAAAAVAAASLAVAVALVAGIRAADGTIREAPEVGSSSRDTETLAVPAAVGVAEATGATTPEVSGLHGRRLQASREEGFMQTGLMPSMWPAAAGPQSRTQAHGPLLGTFGGTVALSLVMLTVECRRLQAACVAAGAVLGAGAGSSSRTPRTSSSSKP